MMFLLLVWREFISLSAREKWDYVRQGAQRRIKRKDGTVRYFEDLTRIPERFHKAVLSNEKALAGWAAAGDPLEMRAVAAAVAEPALLKDRTFAEAALGLQRQVVYRAVQIPDRRSDSFRALRKGLGYTLSVVVQAIPEEGFDLLAELAAKARISAAVQAIICTLAVSPGSRGVRSARMGDRGQEDGNMVEFSDAETQPMPRMLVPVNWEDIRAYCEGAARRLVRHLNGLESWNGSI